MNANLVHGVEFLYDMAISKVQMNCNTEEWFRTTETVAVRQEFIYHPTSASKIISDDRKEYDETAIGGRTITNLWFADSIDALLEE